MQVRVFKIKQWTQSQVFLQNNGFSNFPQWISFMASSRVCSCCSYQELNEIELKKLNFTIPVL
jgi:hypothetical protein